MFACLCVCLFLAMHHICLPTCCICLLPYYIYLPLCVCLCGPCCLSYIPTYCMFIAHCLPCRCLWCWVECPLPQLPSGRLPDACHARRLQPLQSLCAVPPAPAPHLQPGIPPAAGGATVSHGPAGWLSWPAAATLPTARIHRIPRGSRHLPPAAAALPIRFCTQALVFNFSAAAKIVTP